MEKEILIQDLKKRVGEDNCKSISDKTFEGIANVYLPLFADDTKITDETWKYPVAALNEYAGQKRHDDAVFAEKFKTDYAKEYATQHEKDVEERIRVATEKALEDYRKEHPEQGGGSGGSGGSTEETLDEKVAKAVKEAMAGLTGADSDFGKMTATMTNFMKSQMEREKTATLNGVKSQIQSYLTSIESAARKGAAIPAEISALIEDTVKYLEYGENPTFDQLKSVAKSAYEKEYKRRYPNGGKPFGGDSTGGAPSSSDYVKETISRLKKEAEENANYATEQEKTFV